VTRYHGDVIGEPQGAVAANPPATIVKGLRQIPVVQTKPRFDLGAEQCIDQPVVEGEPGNIHGAATRR
jgi:hypothetical protein